MRRRAVFFIAVAATGIVTSSQADGVAVKTLLTGLSNPCGVAVRPDGVAAFQVFISDSAAGRIVCLASNATGTTQDVVRGFAAAASSKGPPHQVGPLGLLFLDSRQLVVGIGAADDKSSLLCVYDVGNRWPLAADQATTRIACPETLRTSAPNPPGVYALARTRANDVVHDSIIVTAGRVGAPRWLLKSRLQADVLGELQEFAAGDSGGARPTAIAVSPSGHVVVANVGTLDGRGDSWLTFYNPVDGSVEMLVDTGLDDIVALAYGLTTGGLYAADFALADADRSGIYRIDDASTASHPACRAVKIAAVRRPTALTFGPDGALYVTAFGDADGQGTLVKLTGDL